MAEELAMKTNIGPLDRKIRFGAGAVILALGLIFQSWFGLIGLVLLGTALIRWCPAYLPFKVNTTGLRNSAQ